MKISTFAPLAALAVILFAPLAHTQPEPLDDDPGMFPPGPPSLGPGGDPVAQDWTGAVRILKVRGATDPAAELKAAAEIFPDSDKVWMNVYGTDPRPIEAARRGARKWLCSAGCDIESPADPEDNLGTSGIAAGNPASNTGDAMLRSIKVQTPTQPLPLTIWRPVVKDTGQLLFDPVLLGRRSYKHVCAYPPVTKKGQLGDEVPICREGKHITPTPDSGELRLGFRWPRSSEFADFQYLAITDTCGNARVMPFQRTFAAPVYHVASGGCGSADGRVLRVFPSGGWLRVTAFNLDTPAAGNVVSATFRVTVPPLEDLVSARTPPMLFPDPRIDDLSVDCGPMVLKARTGHGGIPREAPSAAPSGLPGQKAPPGKKLPGQAPPPGKKLPGQTPPPGFEPPSGGGGDGTAAPTTTPKRPPIVRQPRVLPASTPSGQPLAHQGLVIGPEPLFRGNCRIELRGQTKRRLVAPLALRVRITRTDVPGTPVLLDEPWIVTPSDSIFRVPPLDPSGFDGESRLRLEIYSDPMSTEGNVILLSDAGRVARIENLAVAQAQPEKLRRLIGSVTIHSAPLCGESNFETVEAAGSCFRGYFTVPAMLATLQVTRAPWVERPLITRNVLSAVGVAFAMDSYDPVEREAFPVALQVGGFVQDLGEDRVGLLSYIGVAPTLPILGEGGNTTSVGVLGGLGIEYIAKQNGPDEGFKPAAFLAIVVQVGQANPALPSDGSAFGSYAPPPVQSGTY